MSNNPPPPPVSSSDPDSENYDANNEDSDSPSPPSSSSSPLILYSPPTIWGLLRGAAINLILPFINGLMLGFGELLAHEAAFRLGWSGTRVSSHRVIYWWRFAALSPCDGEIVAVSMQANTARVLKAVLTQDPRYFPHIGIHGRWDLASKCEKTYSSENEDQAKS